MQSRVIVHDSLKSHLFIEQIAQAIAVFYDYGIYADFLGHYGAFENNQNATASQLFKFHIAINQADFFSKHWRSKDGHKRTSDNFVIYAQHFLYQNYFLVLGIITPNAHTRVDKLLPQLIAKAEEFHALNLQALQKFKHYTATQKH